MYDSYKNILKNIRQIDPPRHLYPDIISRIEAENSKAARMRFTMFLGMTLASLSVAIPAFQYAFQEFYKSGLPQYLALIFSDGGTMLAYWQDFTLALAESLPIFGLVMLFSAIFIVLGSLKLMLENMPAAFGHHKLIKI